MITREEQRAAQDYAADELAACGIVLTDAERDGIEVADFGLSRLREQGLMVLVYVNTDRYCAKELVLYPGQTLPRAPASALRRRPRQGGDVPLPPRARPPATSTGARLVLGPGEQFTIPPDTLHSFTAGPEGAVVSEFSSTSRDDLDVFTDPDVRRETVVA